MAISWKTFLILLLVMEQWTAVTTNLYDPHVRPETGPFFEGWYMRLVDPPITLGVLWGYVVPETPQGASKLDFIGALKFEPHTKVLSVNAFPNGKDTKYTVKGGRNVTSDPDISSPAWMKLEAKHIGTLTATQNFTDVNFTIGNVRIQMSLGKATPWNEDFSGPEGSFLQRLPLPLHWFVFSLWTPVTSYTFINEETGESLTGTGGMVHMEKNWGKSFPDSWIWSQGAAAHPEKVTFAVTYGVVSIIGISVPASLAGYRNYDKGIILDFTPLNSIVNVKYSQCGTPASFWIQYYKPFYRKLTVSVTSSQEDFSPCLFGPLKEGFRPVCQESFQATAIIDVYEWGWFSGWQELDHQEIPFAALEFGGKWTCTPCEQQPESIV